MTRREPHLPAVPPARYIEAERVIVTMASFGRHRLETLGPARTVLLGIVAGAFITAGALLSVVLGAGVEPHGLQLLVMGLAFSAGFFFVVLSEAVLFTEVEALLTELVQSKMRYRADGSAAAWLQVVVSGMLANWLVGMAAFFAFMGRTVIGKYIPVALAVTMFVAAGFQHSPANMGYFALLMAQGQGPGSGPALAWKLVPAGLGNMLGGALLVAVPFWYVFPPSAAPSPATGTADHPDGEG